MRIPANLTRSGVFLYRRTDGTEIREYRPPDEVFKTDALAGLSGSPITDLHPKDRVTPVNVRELGVGRVGGDLRRDGSFVAGDLIIEDAKAIAMVERGDRKEVSLGYSCRIDETPGVSPEGERYDCVQRDYRFNHAAIGPEGWGRAGRDVAMRTDSAEPAEGWPRLDAGDAVLVSEGAVPPASPREDRADGGSCMLKLRVDGGTIELPEAAVPVVEQALKQRDDAIEAAKKERDDAVASLEKERDTEKARADKAEAERDDFKTKLDEATDPKKRADEVKARVELLRGAADVLGTSEKLDGLSDHEVRVKVVAKANPKLTLDGKSEAYVEALFDRAVSDKREDGGMKQARTAAEVATRTGDRDDSDEPDAEKLIQHRRDAHKRWLKEG